MACSLFESTDLGVSPLLSRTVDLLFVHKGIRAKLAFDFFKYLINLKFSLSETICNFWARCSIEWINWSNTSYCLMNFNFHVGGDDQRFQWLEIDLKKIAFGLALFVSIWIWQLALCFKWTSARYSRIILLRKTL